jgi:hypothetical protein
MWLKFGTEIYDGYSGLYNNDNEYIRRWIIFFIMKTKLKKLLQQLH